MSTDEQTGKVRIISSESIPPRTRQRPLVAADDYVSLSGPESGEPVVVVHRRVFEDLRTDGTAALPNETVGLLYGRSWQDPNGTWIVVNHYLPAQPEEKLCSPGQSTLTAAGNAQLRRRAEQTFPAEECVGWAHTHTSEEPAFSAGDLLEQRRRSAEAIGLLAYLRQSAGTWYFTVYLGDTAKRLEGPVAPAARSSEVHGLESAHPRSGGDPHRAFPVAQTQVVRAWPSRRQRRIVLAGSPLIALVLLALGFLGDRRGWWRGIAFLEGLDAAMACGLVLLPVGLLAVHRAIAPVPPSGNETGAGRARLLWARRFRMRRTERAGSTGRPVWPVWRSIVVIAVIVAVVIFSSIVFTADAPRAAHAPSSPAASTSEDAMRLAATVDALSVYNAYWQTYVAAATGAANGEALARYVGDPYLAVVWGQLTSQQDVGIVYRGHPVRRPRVVAVDLAARPETVTIVDCVDVTDWRAVDRNTGSAVDPDQSPHGVVVSTATATATATDGRTWLITDSHVDSARSC